MRNNLAAWAVLAALAVHPATAEPVADPLGDPAALAASMATIARAIGRAEACGADAFKLRRAKEFWEASIARHPLERRADLAREWSRGQVAGQDEAEDPAYDCRVARADLDGIVAMVGR